MKFFHGADYNYEQWLHRPAVLDEDFVAMKAAGCNVMSVGIFSWARLEPQEGQYDFAWLDTLLDRLHDHGLKAILATPTAAKPTWVSRTYPTTRIMNAQGQRDPHGWRHNHCRTSKEFRRLATNINRRLAERYGRHPAVALWHVNNEYGATRCYCPECLAAFRGWLQRRYGTLEAVNHAWWTDFWSHRFSSWDEIEPVDGSITGLMLDWARFTSDQTIDFFLAESAPLRELTPHLPITTNFHGPDTGLDYFAFAPHVDVVSWDSYPRWHVGNDAVEAARVAFHHDLFRSLKRRPFLLMESTPSQTNWQGVSPLKRPGLHQSASLLAVAHGSDSVQYFQWRQGRGGEETWHGSVLTTSGSTDTRVFREVADVGRALEGLDRLAGSAVRSEVAVVLDLVNHWALGLAQIPRNHDKNYWDEVATWHRALSRRAYGVDVIDSVSDLSGYRVVAVPQLFLLRPGVAEAFEAFVEAGGTLIVTTLSGWVDDTMLAPLGDRPGALARLLGVRVDEWDVIPEGRTQGLSVPTGSVRTARVTAFADVLTVIDAEVRGTFTQDFYAGRPALTCRRVGKGRAWYLGARVDAEFLEAFLDERCREAGVNAEVAWSLPPGVLVRRRGTGDRETLFAFNFSEASVVLPRPGAPVTLAPWAWAALTPLP